MSSIPSAPFTPPTFSLVFDQIRILSSFATVTVDLGGPVRTQAFPTVNVASSWPVKHSTELLLGGRVVMSK